MSLGRLLSLYQLWWMFKSHSQQRLAWADAEEARLARIRAEHAAALQHQAMLDANPSGSLGHSKLNDTDVLKREGLL